MNNQETWWLKKGERKEKKKKDDIESSLVNRNTCRQISLILTVVESLFRVQVLKIRYWLEIDGDKDIRKTFFFPKLLKCQKTIFCFELPRNFWFRISFSFPNFKNMGKKKKNEKKRFSTIFFFEWPNWIRIHYFWFGIFFLSQILKIPFSCPNSQNPEKKKKKKEKEIFDYILF